MDSGVEVDGEALYAAHRRVVFDYALRRTGSVPDAESLVQEAFVRTLRAMRSGSVAHPRAYLLRTAANLATDRDRRRAREPSEDDVPEGSIAGHGVETPVEPGDASDHARVRAAVTGLDEGLQSVLALRYGESLSFRKIAQKLGMSTNAVHHRHQRAIAMLRGILGVEDD